ncbi:MAG: YifB family Mg chelatase-like AAA ATPase [Candidatus Omnitrophica bacterium]|nr:YifB family Mg chelatase-like AAA ATPase [Candidatus Omnitrophota bacterium]
MLAKVQSAACAGIKAYSVEVEADVSFGLPDWRVVGLPDVSIKEAKERVRTAIKNSGYDFPGDKITINLAPADVKKEGSSFDLPIALGILAANGTISQDSLDSYTFLGELALDGSLRPFKGALVIANGFQPGRAFILPEQNARESSLAKNARIYAAKNLNDVVAFLQKEKNLPVLSSSFSFEAPSADSSAYADFSDVRGQHYAKRALEIAVSGHHNVLFIGSPGAGKTMLAKRVPGILPALTMDEAIEVTKIYSVAGFTQNSGALISHRPFRAPHYSLSSAALVGGGSSPRPGEVSLAHKGVLFLDEFPEFRRDALESLRSPIEDKEITISRSKIQITYPSEFLLIAAMNPCPCGFLRDRKKQCRCSLSQIHKYQSKISGPILDRIDLHVEVSPVTYQTLSGEGNSGETSAVIRNRVMDMRKLQHDRYRHLPYKLNALLQPREIKKFAPLHEEGKKLLEMAMKELHLSARAYFKILKVARTIADMAGEEQISCEHLAEAIQYRSFDRQW